jgi:hypothetical protein
MTGESQLRRSDPMGENSLGTLEFPMLPGGCAGAIVKPQTQLDGFPGNYQSRDFGGMGA